MKTRQFHLFIKHRSRQLRRNCLGATGFTLVEVLVAMAVLLLIIAMLAQVVQNATASIQRSTKGMDNNQLTTIALDRIGNSIAGMITSGQGTLVAIKNSNGSDGLAMLTNGRVRSRTSGLNVSVSGFSDIRLGARGYCIISVPDPDLPNTSSGSPPLVPMLNGGDGTVTWTSQTATDIQGDPLQALFLGLTDVVNAAANNSTADSKMLQFDPLNRNIFRFEICFLLSDGSLVSNSPPLNAHLITGGAPPVATVTLNPTSTSGITCLPLAFTSRDSNAPVNQIANSSPPAALPVRYVKAVVVGIASLDSATLRLLSSTQLVQLGGVTDLPKANDGQTPLQAWSISTFKPPNYPLPVLQNLRFTQRYFYVN